MKKSKSLLASIEYQGDIKNVRGKILNIYEIRKKFGEKCLQKNHNPEGRDPLTNPGDESMMLTK